MSERNEYLGQRESLRLRRKGITAEITSHRDSIRSALPIIGDVGGIDGDYVLSLAAKLADRMLELRDVDTQIEILTRQLEG